MMMKPCQTLLNENMQQRGRKKNKRKGPKSWNTNKTQKKGANRQEEGEQIMFPVLPHSQKNQKVMLEKLDKNTHYCGSFLNVCI
jgi:hypothetical protein